MKDDQEILTYLTQLKDLVEKIITTLPEGVGGRVCIRKDHVRADLKGPRLGVFTLVLGSETPELAYNERYTGFRTIPGGLDEVVEFAKETIYEVADFILGDEPLVEHKRRFLRRAYVCIPRTCGPEWKLEKIT